MQQNENGQMRETKRAREREILNKWPTACHSSKAFHLRMLFIRIYFINFFFSSFSLSISFSFYPTYSHFICVWQPVPVFFSVIFRIFSQCVNIHSVRHCPMRINILLITASIEFLRFVICVLCSVDI